MDTSIKDGENFYFSLDDIRGIVKKKKHSYILLKDGHSVSVDNSKIDKVIELWAEHNHADIHDISEEKKSYVDTSNYPVESSKWYFRINEAAPYKKVTASTIKQFKHL